jgi:hypothetical protein
MGAKPIEAFGDLLLVMKQITVNVSKGLEMHLLTNALKLLLFSMILLYSMFLRMKNQVSDQIEENLVFWKNQMFQFAKPDSPVFSRCTMQKSVLLNQIQQNRTVRLLKPEGPKFPGHRTNQVK